MQFKKIAFFIISITILFTGCDSKKEKKEEVKKEIIKKNTNNFKLISQDLKEVNLNKTDDGMIFKELKGKVVLLNFFATWCPPCKAEIPHLNNLKEKYKDSFEVIAVSLGKGGGLPSSEKMESFINDFKINYIVTNTPTNFDVADAMGGIRSIPTMFLFDPSGKIVQKYVGIVPEEMIESDIKKALGK